MLNETGSRSQSASNPKITISSKKNIFSHPMAAFIRICFGIFVMEFESHLLGEHLGIIWRKWKPDFYSKTCFASGVQRFPPVRLLRCGQLPQALESTFCVNCWRKLEKLAKSCPCPMSEHSQQLEKLWQAVWSNSLKYPNYGPGTRWC